MRTRTSSEWERQAAIVIGGRQPSLPPRRRHAMSDGCQFVNTVLAMTLLGSQDHPRIGRVSCNVERERQTQDREHARTTPRILTCLTGKEHAILNTEVCLPQAHNIASLVRSTSCYGRKAYGDYRFDILHEICTSEPRRRQQFAKNGGAQTRYLRRSHEDDEAENS